MNQTCKNCIHWEYAGYTMGICNKITDELNIFIDGEFIGNNTSIETDCNFGCNQFEDRDE